MQNCLGRVAELFFNTEELDDKMADEIQCW